MHTPDDRREAALLLFPELRNQTNEGFYQLEFNDDVADQITAVAELIARHRKLRTGVDNLVRQWHDDADRGYTLTPRGASYKLMEALNTQGQEREAQRSVS